MANNSFYYAGQQPASQPAGPSFNNNLASNNPFRNRTASPASLDAAFVSSPSPFDDPPPPQRPLSRNPFLDVAPASLSQVNPAHGRPDTRSLTAEDIFGSLTLDERKANSNQLIDFEPVDAVPQQQRPMPQYVGENHPPSRPGAQNRHRPTLSQEEALRARKPQFAVSKAPLALESPLRKPQQRPRRNSDSSLMDFDRRRQSDDEKAVPGARRQDRDSRRRDVKDRAKTGRPSRRMDIIDQLDATSIYGTGLFHHDGPFDALNPHRNRQSGKRLAPMQAFPKDSLNNTLGGAGPLNSRADHSQFMGHGTDEAFNDYATTGRKGSYGYSSSKDTAIFDPVSRGNMVHGDETYGLGTSTFLEGTPAARSTIVRREAEHQQEMAEGGLQRKKSLAQRIRKINRGTRDSNPSGRSIDQSRYGASLGSEGGPYSSEPNQADDDINIEKGRDGKISPPPVLRSRSGSNHEQRAANDTGTVMPREGPAKTSGLLGRMKSLKGGRRPVRAEAQ